MTSLYASPRVKRAGRRTFGPQRERKVPCPAGPTCTTAPMRDLVFLAVIVGFFAVAALVVAACDRIVGPDPADLDHPGGDR